MRRKVQTFPGRIIKIKGAFKIAGYRCQASAFARLHADGVELQHQHAIVIIKVPKLREILNQWTYQSCGCAQLHQRIGDMKRFQSGQGIKRHNFYFIVIQFFDINPTVVGDGHYRATVFRAFGNRKIDLVIGRHRPFIGDTVRLYLKVPIYMFGKIQTFLFFESIGNIVYPTQ